jgi:8-oxo-dGTP diphosphatase
MEDGEPAPHALARELHEELGIGVRTAYPWVTRVHAYEHATVRLNFFRVTRWSGEPHPRERQAFVWQSPCEPIASPMLPANAPVLASLALPREYAITDAETFGVGDMLSRVQVRLEQGLRLIQVRDKNLPDRDAFARSVLQLSRPFKAKVLINCGPAGKHGIHAMGDGIHFTAQRLMALKERPARGLAAASCHTREELERAMQLELDFAVLGPVRRTTSHEGAPTLGWDRFAAIARGASIPVYAIGGMRREEIETAWRAGAHGLAMISGAWDQAGR